MPKKSDGVLRETKVAKYAFIESLREEFKITKMCRWLCVSRSGYYRWRTREPSQRAMKREMVRCAVLDVYHQFKKRYGAPRITEELNALGMDCSKNHVAELLQIEGLKARNGKAFKYQPSAYATYNVSPNLLARNFQASQPDEKWVSDISYIDVDGQWMHLAVIMDLYSRQIIGWAVDETMTTELILEAFNMAVTRRQIKPGLILHSDRGVQYRSGEYQEALKQQQIRSSMSRKGNCWDNAVMESFFSRLKVELVYAEDFKTFGQAYRALFEYIELFYNRVRRHSSLGYISPAQYEERFYAQCA
ncbi:MAG: IS3 family transposase [Candidatus Thiodiazotropha sp. (ex Lucinoma borealis)]|nr:IS3 family transposase [Candidatus Thiodiazotropha sp. (ex Lucinoma borealis)]